MKKFLMTLAIAGVSAMLVSAPVMAEEADAVAIAQHAELKDGTKIEIQGGAVSVIGKDGKATPAPDGTHETKDGKKITTKGGKVVE